MTPTPASTPAPITPTLDVDEAVDIVPPNDRFVVPILPALLLPHPANPRGAVPLSREAVADLVASIKANGQRQPCLVRPISPSRTVGIEGPVGPAQLYEIVLGRRRARACELLEREALCMVVEDLRDDDALAIMLSEQAVKSDPDPILEAEAVSALLARPGWTLAAVAAQLGKPLRWVAQRANLRTLTPRWRELRRDAENQVSSWPVGWLEEVAALAAETQDDLAEQATGVHRNEHWSHQDLRDLIGERIHTLGSAKWDLADPALLPRAGACTTCPKTSARSPGLFDEADLDPAKPEDLARAKCRDAKCWEAKEERYRLMQVQQLREAAGGKTKVAVVRGSWDAAIPGVADRHARTGAGATPAKEIDGGVLETYEATQRKVAAGTKGAIPALVVGGKDDGKTFWIAPTKGRRKETAAEATAEDEDKGAPKGPKGASIDIRSEKERLKESREAIRRRREGYVVDLVREAVEVLPPPAFELTATLLACFELNAPDGAEWGAAPKERAAIASLVSTDNGPGAPRTLVRDRWAAEVWLRSGQDGSSLRDAIARALRRNGGDPHDKEYALATWLGGLLGLGVERIEKAAEEAIPAPKWWPQEPAKPAAKAEKAVAPAKKGAAKR